MVNGIPELATQPDLLDRSIVLTLPHFPDDKRITEKMLWHLFNQAHPRILGAILDAVAMGLCNLPAVKLENPPRMADFAEWIVATEPALPWKVGDFMAAYTGNRDAGDDFALESSPIGGAIVELLNSICSPMRGPGYRAIPSLRLAV